MHECLIQFKNLYEFHQFLLSDFFRAKFPIAPRWKYVPERQNVLICLICILLSQNVNRNQMSSFHYSKKTFDNKLQDYENISFTQSNSFTLLILIVFNTYIMNYNFPVDSRSLLTFLSLYIAQSYRFLSIKPSILVILHYSSQFKDKFRCYLPQSEQTRKVIK